MIKLKFAPQVYESRRGPYQIVELPPTIGDANLLVWMPMELGSSERADKVRMEVDYAKLRILAEHPYWKDEPLDFINEYSKLYRELFGLKWLHKKEDRHNIVVNPVCCMTLVQYNNGTLTAYSRSTDMRNGYFSDRLILDYLAETINRERPDCKVDKIVWYLAVPHVYLHKGIARLQEETK